MMNCQLYVNFYLINLKVVPGEVMHSI